MVCLLSQSELLGMRHRGTADTKTHSSLLWLVGATLSTRNYFSLW
eukprot:COSAG06_NODE_24801_length_652_cov_0.839060_1_plen_44_part_10